MASGFVNLPPLGTASWREPVASDANLPASGNTVGDAIVTKDTQLINIWDGASWTHPAGTGTVTSVALAVPAASIFGVSGSPVTTSGTLTISTTGNSGGIPYFSSGSVISSSAALTANQLIKGGGAGAAPSTLAAGSQYQVLVMGATTPGYGALDLSQTAATTNTLLASRGGLGANFSAASGAVSVSSGTFAAGILTPANGGTGANFSASTGAISVSGGSFAAGILSAANGGTGVNFGASTGAISVSAGSFAAGILSAANGGTGANFSASTGAVSVSAGSFAAGTMSVANGGTAATSFTAYSVLCGGTTSTGAFQNVSGVGTSGQVLTSAGASALPTWSALPSCHVRANTAAAPTMTSGNAFTQFSPATENYDTDNAYSSGTFTVPTGKGGYYAVGAQVTSANVLWAVADYIQLIIYVNGAEAYSFGHRALENAVTIYCSVNGRTTINVNAGDTIAVYVKTNRAAGNYNLHNDGEINWLTIDRII